MIGLSELGGDCGMYADAMHLSYFSLQGVCHEAMLFHSCQATEFFGFYTYLKTDSY